MYKTDVDRRFGITGLTRLVVNETGGKPKLTMGYVFKIKNQNRIKILTRDEIGTNLLDLFDSDPEQINEFVEEPC